MPALSRDGKRLAFVTRLPGRWALEVTNLQSESQRTVAWERMSLRYPNFGPTDDNIIYSNSSQSKKLAISGGLGESLPFNNVTDSSPRGDLLAQPDDYHSIDIVDGTTGKLIQFVADSQTALYQAHFSLDGRWVTFNSTRNDHSQLFVVPFRKGLVPKNEWIAVTDGTVWDDKPRFASNERFLIFTSDRDGFRCIWAEQLGPDMHPNGKPYPLYHLHAPKRSVDGATGGGLELAVAPGVVVFNQGERTGNIWLLDTH
jgi:Tol biopolymer transport system component